MTYREIIAAYREEERLAGECRRIQLAAIMHEDYDLADEAGIAARMHHMCADEIIRTKGACLADWDC